MKVMNHEHGVVDRVVAGSGVRDDVCITGGAIWSDNMLGAIKRGNSSTRPRHRDSIMSSVQPEIDISPLQLLFAAVSILTSFLILSDYLFPLT